MMDDISANTENTKPEAQLPAITENEPSTTGKKHPKKVFLKIIFIIFICVFAGSLAYIGYIAYGYFNQQNIEDTIGDMFDAAKLNAATPTPVVSPTPVASDETPEAAPYESAWTIERRMLLEAEARGKEIYADILAINEDFLGMIEIPGIVTRQPYVMSHDNREYLNRDFNGNKSGTGTVFLSAFNDRLLMDNNSVIFGHYSDTGVMFANIPQYKKASTYKESPVIILDSLTGESIWIIFAAHVVEPDEWWVLPIYGRDEYTDHLEEILARSLFHTDVDITPDDRIITLAVCDYTYEDMRFLVHARKLRPGESVPESVTAVVNNERKDYSIPHINKVNDVDLKNMAMTVNPSTNRLYFFALQEGVINRYTGDKYNIQGPFNILKNPGINTGIFFAAGLNKQLDEDNDRSVHIAIERFNNLPGITLFTSAVLRGTIREEGLVTPEGVDARYPAIQNDNNILHLLYNVPGDDFSAVYIQNIRSSDSMHLYTVENINDVRPLGLFTVYEQTVLVWHEYSSGEINAIRIGSKDVFNIDKVESNVRIILYGPLNEDLTVKYVAENSGSVSFSVFDLSITPVTPYDTPGIDSDANTDSTNDTDSNSDDDSDETPGIDPYDNPDN